jgi:hypothetical protein
MSGFWKRTIRRALLVWVLLPMHLTAPFALCQEPALPLGSTADGASTLPEFASFSDALQFADDAWVFGDYDLVIRVLESRLLPSPPPVEEGVLVHAWSRLGSSAYYEENEELAYTCFLELLRLDSSHTLDRLLFPAQVIAFFERVRSENAASLEVSTPAASSGDTIYLVRSSTRQSRLVSALPLGYGFFTQDRDIEGTVYLLGEAALGIASAWLYIANETSRDAAGYYADPGLAERRQRAQVGTGIAFFVLLAANVLHGALTHPAETDFEYQTLDALPSEVQTQSGARRWRIGFHAIIGNTQP